MDRRGVAEVLLSATTTTPGFGTYIKKLRMEGHATQHNPGTPITQRLSKVALNKGFDENSGQLPQEINEDENENEEYRDTSLFSRSTLQQEGD